MKIYFVWIATFCFDWPVELIEGNEVIVGKDWDIEHFCLVDQFKTIQPHIAIGYPLFFIVCHNLTWISKNFSFKIKYKQAKFDIDNILTNVNFFKKNCYKKMFIPFLVQSIFFKKNIMCSLTFNGIVQFILLHLMVPWCLNFIFLNGGLDLNFINVFCHHIFWRIWLKWM